jgi:hypothetical protein
LTHHALLDPPLHHPLLAHSLFALPLLANLFNNPTRTATATIWRKTWHLEPGVAVVASLSNAKAPQRRRVMARESRLRRRRRLGMIQRRSLGMAIVKHTKIEQTFLYVVLPHS